MRKSIIGIGIAVIVGLFFVFSVLPAESPIESGLSEKAGYEATVCPTITRADGSIERIECSHNVLTNTGMNATRNFLGLGSDTEAFDFVGLECGVNVPNKLNTSFTEECIETGLTREQGTYMAHDEFNGNWSIYNTFTLTGSADIVYGAGLFNHTSVNHTLAIANFTTFASLATNDQLTVNWTLTVS